MCKRDYSNGLSSPLFTHNTPQFIAVHTKCMQIEEIASGSPTPPPPATAQMLNGRENLLIYSFHFVNKIYDANSFCLPSSSSSLYFFFSLPFSTVRCIMWTFIALHFHFTMCICDCFASIKFSQLIDLLHYLHFENAILSRLTRAEKAAFGALLLFVVKVLLCRKRESECRRKNFS